MDGKILFSLDYFEDKNSAGFGMGGGGELAIGNITGDPLNVTSLSIMGDLTLRSREVERKAVVNASILVELREYNESIRSSVTKGFVNISRILLVITPETLNTSFVIATSGVNMTIPSEYVNNVNASKIINEKLEEYNLTFIRFENLTIISHNDTYIITGNVSIDNKELLKTAIDKELITHEEAEEIIYGLSKMLKDIDGVGRIAAVIVNETYAGGSKILMKHEEELKIDGDVQEFREELMRFGPTVTKYMYLVTSIFRLTVYGGVFPQPLQPSIQVELPPIYEPKLTPEYPFRFSIFVDAGFNRTHADVTLDVDVLKLRYTEPIEDPVESLRTSLREVRDFLINVSKPLAIFELMGMGSPIPEKIYLSGARYGDKFVEVKPEEVSIPELTDVEIAIVYATVTTPSTETGITITVIGPTETATTMTTTVTHTTTHTTTVTEKVTETTTVTERYTETSTYIPPEVTTMSIGLGATVIILAIATALLALMLRRKS